MQNEKIAVISGATHGIGKAIAEKLLRQGFSLAICSRNESELLALQTLWLKDFPNAKVLIAVADFSKKEQVLQFAATVKKRFPKVSILVNNAGIFHPGTLLEEPEGQLEDTINVNLYSAYHLTRALLSCLSAGSSIFNICSVASLKAYPNGGSYSISKYALLGFSENLREELKPRGIRVTAICPGATWSRSWSDSGIDRERIMEANDVAEMLFAAYNLSPKADVETIVLRPILGDI